MFNIYLIKKEKKKEQRIKNNIIDICISRASVWTIETTWNEYHLSAYDIIIISVYRAKNEI